jgi:hypothetical protein
MFINSGISDVNLPPGSYNYKKYSNYGHYKRDEDVEKREAAPEPEPEPAGKYSHYGTRCPLFLSFMILTAS